MGLCHGSCTSIAFVTNDAALAGAINIPYESHFGIDDGDVSMAREAPRSCSLSRLHVAESLEALHASTKYRHAVHLLPARATLQWLRRFEG
jgi:hypothetical protein